VASSFQLFGVSKFISVPSAAALVWVMIVFGDYKKLEKIFVFLSFLYHCLRRHRHPCETQLARSFATSCQNPLATRITTARLLVFVGWRHWRYDRSLAAVLSAGLDCREGLFSKASQVQSDRRHCRIVVFRHCCRIYRRRVCCHTFHARLYTYQRCG